MVKKIKQTLDGNDHPISGLYQLNVMDYWQVFRAQPLCVWAICLYIMNEFLRLQSLFPFLAGLPISSALLGITLLTWISNSKQKYIADNFLWLLIVFFIIIIFSIINAYDSGIGYENLELYISWVVVYFLIVQNITTEKRLLLFTWFLFLPLFKMSLFGARSWVGSGFAFTDWGVSGPEGFFENSGELSLLMTMFFAMSLGLYIGLRTHLTTLKKVFMLLLPLTSIMTVLASATRGSQLALLVQILILSILYKKVTFKGIVITVLALFLAYSYLPEEQKKRFESAGTDRTSKARLVYWQKGFEMLQEHPVSGVGYFNFPVYFDYKYPEYKVFKNKSEAAHNHVVQIAATLGYPGLILYLFIIYGCYKVSSRCRNKLAKQNLKDHWIYPFSIGMDCAIVGYFIGAMFMSVAFYPYLWIHSAYIVATYNAANRIVESNNQTEIETEK